MVLKELLNTSTVAKDKAYANWIQEALAGADVLEEMVKFAFEGTDKERTRACWILHHIGDRKPELLLGFVERMIDQLDHAKTDAEMRLFLGISPNMSFYKAKKRKAGYCITAGCA